MRKRAVCGMCQGGCDVVVTVEDGRIARVSADAESDRGRLCSRGAHAPDALYGEQRIMHPMVRDAGTGELRRASWDEALDRAAELVRAVAVAGGPRAMASYFGRGVLGTPVMRMGKGNGSLLSRLGSPNDMSCASICFLSSNVVVPVTCMGIPAAKIVPDVARSDVIVVWGQNPATEEGPQLLLRKINEARARGARLVVVDPRRAGIGEIADWWIPVTPGGDGALAIALIKHVIESGRYDKSFVADFTVGFDGLVERVAHLDADCLSARCGVSCSDVAKLADLICSTNRVSLVTYTGVEYQPGAVAAGRALQTLWAITGKLDVEGGMYLSVEGSKDFRFSKPPADAVPVGAREFPLFYAFRGEGQFCQLPKAVLEDDPYPMRGLLVVGGSPACSFPGGDLWPDVYRKLDCLVVMDRFFTEETRFADVVLPAASLFETVRLISSPAGSKVLPPVVEPAGEARDDILVLSDIARRLGVGEGLPSDGNELAAWLLAGAPTALAAKGRAYGKYRTGALRADGVPGFPTESGKFEIYSQLLADAGFDPLPGYTDAAKTPELQREAYPLTLTTGARSNNRMGVYGPSIPALARLEPAPCAELSEVDARELGVRDGDVVRVITPFGSGEHVARVGGMAAGAVHVPHGGGSAFMPAAWRCGSANNLTPLDVCDEVTGFPLIKAVPCRVELVES